MSWKPSFFDNITRLSRAQTSAVYAAAPLAVIMVVTATRGATTDAVFLRRLREAAQKQPKTTEKRRREAEGATREQPRRKRQRTSRTAKPASRHEDETTPLTEIPRPPRKRNLARRAPAAAAGSERQPAP